jgi:hypothetical protein
MSNLYSITTNQEALIRLFRVVNRYVGNLAPMPGVYTITRCGRWLQYRPRLGPRCIGGRSARNQAALRFADDRPVAQS